MLNPSQIHPVWAKLQISKDPRTTPDSQNAKPLSKHFLHISIFLLQITACLVTKCVTFGLLNSPLQAQRPQKMEI